MTETPDTNRVKSPDPFMFNFGSTCIWIENKFHHSLVFPGLLPHPVKIAIAGNHEECLDSSIWFYPQDSQRTARKKQYLKKQFGKLMVQ